MWKKIALKTVNKNAIKKQVSSNFIIFLIVYGPKNTYILSQSWTASVPYKNKLIKYDWFQSTSPSYILRKYNAFAWIDVIDIHQHSPVIKDNEQEKLNISCRQFVVILTIGQNRFETNRYVIRPLIGQKLSFILQWNS